MLESYLVGLKRRDMGKDRQIFIILYPLCQNSFAKHQSSGTTLYKVETSTHTWFHFTGAIGASPNTT